MNRERVLELMDAARVELRTLKKPDMPFMERLVAAIEALAQPREEEPWPTMQRGERTHSAPEMARNAYSMDPEKAKDSFTRPAPEPSLSEQVCRAMGFHGVWNSRCQGAGGTMLPNYGCFPWSESPLGVGAMLDWLAPRLSYMELRERAGKWIIPGWNNIPIAKGSTPAEALAKAVVAVGGQQ